MIERFAIAGYARISVDEELDRDNVSIENQKAIIEDFVKHRFPDSTLTFYEDRDRSGYTFEQREGYQEMRRGLMSHKYDILIVKDFSRFSRRNSRGLVELEDLRDAGVRTQLYTEQKKFKAKMNYADKTGVPYVVFLGEDEVKNNVIACKDMTSGEQTTLDFAATLARVRDGLAERNKGKVIVEK